jgi:hypothetical protein
MRIVELLEGKKFNDLDFIRKDGDKSDIDFDLIEDITYFLNNDDDVYRRHVFPIISNCVNSIKRKKQVSPLVFQGAVAEGYKEYVKKFPIRELPDSIDQGVCEKVCEKMHEELCKDLADGKYKD